MIEYEDEHNNNTYYDDSVQFFGAFVFMAPVEIDDLAIKYKGLLSQQSELKEELKVEIYCGLIPHIKKELIRLGLIHCNIDDGISLAYDITDYLLEKWEVKYYQNRNLIKNNLKCAKKNSFYGYYFTYFKSMFYQKWNYSKEFNGNLIKRSKDLDTRVKKECATIDRRVNLSKENKEIMKDNIRKKYYVSIYDGDFDELEIEDYKVVNVDRNLSLREHLDRNYTKCEIECLLYKANISDINMDKLASICDMSKRKVIEMISITMDKARNDKVLYDLWKY